jgi:hypothetical protein
MAVTLPTSAPAIFAIDLLILRVLVTSHMMLNVASGSVKVSAVDLASTLPSSPSGGLRTMLLLAGAEPAANESESAATDATSNDLPQLRTTSPSVDWKQ